VNKHILELIELSKIDKEKSAFATKVNAFNQAKSDIDKGLSTEQEKFNDADGQIKTSKKRFTLIEKRLPDITSELEKMSQNQGTVDSELEEVKKSIQKMKGKQNNINEKIYIKVKDMFNGNEYEASNTGLLESHTVYSSKFIYPVKSGEEIHPAVVEIELRVFNLPWFLRKLVGA